MKREARSANPARYVVLLMLVALGCARPTPEGKLTEGGPGPLDRVRQLTFEGRRAGEGYFDSAGRALVFQSEREPGNPFYQIYRLDLATGDVRRLSTGVGKTTCAWFHPDGGRVLFASTHHDPDSRAAQAQELERRASGEERRYTWDYDPEYELYAVQQQSGELTRLTHARGYDAEGSYSPDGSLIVFASNRHAHEEPGEVPADPSVSMELYRMNADGSDLRRLTHSPGYDGGPFFSPDGQRVVWRRFSLDGATAEIFTMDLEGGDVRQLTRMGAMSWAPFYHPSGEYVVFTTNVQGFANFELYMVDVEGKGEPVRVTHAPGFDGLAAFSPDGSRLAFSSTRTQNGKSQLFVGDWDHSAARTSLGSAATAPVYPEPKGNGQGTPAALRAHVEALTADEMAGRATGTTGEQHATLYVSQIFQRLGLEPAGDAATYFSAFDYASGVALGASNSLESSGPSLRVDEDWRPLAFSRTGKSERAPVVFAGYGIVAPETEGSPAYDSYAGFDVRDKWVVLLRFLPEDVNAERRQALVRYSGMRYKAMVARDLGAHGILFVNGPRSQAGKPLVPLRGDASLAELSLFTLSVHPDAAERLLGTSLVELQRALDEGDAVPGFGIEGLELEASVDLVRERGNGRNVVGRLPGRSDDARPPLVIGAHVDHLGSGGAGSLARSDEQGRVHHGADDNASGVAVLLEVAGALAASPPERDVLFVAWSGEELGLLGSTAFTRDLPPPTPHDVPAERRYSAYLNMDMVGRLRDRLTLNGIGSSSIWRKEVERLNVRFGLPLTLQDDSYLPSDSTPFYLKGVPVFGAWTGAHSEYHTPRDTADRLNYEGMRDITRFMTQLARNVADRDAEPDYIAMERPGGAGPPRATLRAYLGTIPDYSNTDASGLALSGVIRGGPADQGGLRAGDRIVELAGRRVENIYDYTYAIEGLKVGEPVTVRVVREGAPLEITLTPGSRE